MATLNISLTDEMCDYVNERIASGGYGSASEYFCELLRLDQDRVKREALERALLDGIRSGEPEPLTRSDFDQMRARIGELATKKAASSHEPE